MMSQGFTISGDGTNTQVLALGCVSQVTNSTPYYTGYNLSGWDV